MMLPNPPAEDGVLELWAGGFPPELSRLVKDPSGLFGCD